MRHEAPSDGRPYRGTSLIRNSAPLGPYSKTVPPRALWWSWGEGAVSDKQGTLVAWASAWRGLREWCGGGVDSSENKVASLSSIQSSRHNLGMRLELATTFAIDPEFHCKTVGSGDPIHPEDARESG